jgi:hypothetical protein
MDPSEGRLSDDRKTRIARNEALFREVNERVSQVTEPAPSEQVEFLCECGDAECTESISLTLAEYERLRADPLVFGVKGGHAILDVEEVIGENERFQTVRKHEEASRVARATDPRS